MARRDKAERAFVELEAQRREIAWRRTAPERARARADERAIRSLGDRLDRAARELELVSASPAGVLSAPIARTTPESAPPPPAELPGALSALTMIRVHLEVLELALDAYLGVAEPADLRWATTDVKNLVVVTRFRGVPSATVAADFPELGSARTIERVRRAAGLRPSTGLEA
jgi:hypothetical protein